MRTLSSAWAQLAARPSRIAATITAIVIGTGFACAALVFTSTFQQDFAARLTVQYTGADVVVTPNTAEPVQQMAADIDAIPNVAAAEPLYDSGIEFTSAHSHNYLNLQTYPAEPAFRWANVVSGHSPAQQREVVVDRDTATAANLPVGATLTLTGPGGPDNAAPPTRTVTVVGIADTRADPVHGGSLTAFAPAALFDSLGVTYASAIAVRGAAGTDQDALAAAIGERLGSDAIVRTVAQQGQHEVQMYTDGGTALTTVLLGFAAIALVVAGIVIANTFTILLTQRRRQIALLRCVGATGAQVRRQAIAEAGIVGGVGAVLGAAVGIGAGAVAASLAGFDSGGLAVPVVGVAAVTLVGAALTVAAAVLPATRAMRIPPLAALRPVAEPAVARRASRVRVTVGVGFVAAGGALLAAGVYRASVVTALPGGAISAVGVLLLTRSFLPPLLRGLGGIARAAGVPGRLAAANAVRNPGRAAATSAALVVGVGLIVMLQVAAASVGASIDKAMADRYPVDVSVAGDGSPLPAAAVAGVRTVSGMERVVAVPGAPGQVTTAQGRALPDDTAGAGASAVASPAPSAAEPPAAASAAEPPATGTGAGTAAGTGADMGDATAERTSNENDPTRARVTIVGVPADAATVVRGGLDQLQNPGPIPTALVPPWWVGNGLVGLGDRITVTVERRSQQFAVAVGRLTDAGVNGPAVLIPQADLHALAPNAPTVAIWGALAEPDAAPAVASELNALLANQPDIFVTGSATARAGQQSTLNTVTTVATGLLAVAVVIAIVGIGNTIGLSVVERTRESALLRALGLRRGQLRLTLAIEALLLSLLGALVGIALGLVYGWAGAASAFGEIGRELVLRVPWGTVALVLLVAVAAGALASVLPARRAARAQPVQALAAE